MDSKLFHRWWLVACVAALLIATRVGGFGIAVTAAFVVLYLIGAALIRDGKDSGPTDVQEVSAEPVPVANTADDETAEPERPTA